MVSYREYEDPETLAARLARDQQWAQSQRDRDAAEETRHSGFDHGAHHQPYAMPPPPAPLRPADDIPEPAPASNPYDLLRRLNASRSDPETADEEARALVADRVAQAGLDAGTSERLAPREALRRLGVAGNPDGTRLSGSRALALIRDTPKDILAVLGIAGVGHEPGCAP